MKTATAMRESYAEAVMKTVVSAAVDSVANNDLFGKSAEVFAQDAALRAAINAAFLLTGIEFTVTQRRAMRSKMEEALEIRSRAL